MRKIFISAGHSNKKGRDRGASGCGYIEGELAVEFRDLLMKEIENLGYSSTADGNNTILSESINFFKRLTSPNSILLDIHWNAAGLTATGVESFVPDVPSNFELKTAAGISRIVHEECDIPLRGNFKGYKGVKTESESPRKRLGWMRLIGENILLEMCFISNCRKDMKVYQEKKHIIAKRVAKFLVEQATGKKISNSENQTFHIVKSGDTLYRIAKNYNVKVSQLISLNNLENTRIYVGQKLRIR